MVAWARAVVARAAATWATAAVELLKLRMRGVRATAAVAQIPAAVARVPAALARAPAAVARATAAVTWAPATAVRGTSAVALLQAQASPQSHEAQEP